MVLLYLGLLNGCSVFATSEAAEDMQVEGGSGEVGEENVANAICFGGKQCRTTTSSHESIFYKVLFLNVCGLS